MTDKGSQSFAAMNCSECDVGGKENSGGEASSISYAIAIV